jgi:hypothetical protein
MRTPSMNRPSDFKELLEEFAREGVEHVVIGGSAFAYLAEPRAKKDAHARPLDARVSSLDGSTGRALSRVKAGFGGLNQADRRMHSRHERVRSADLSRYLLDVRCPQADGRTPSLEAGAHQAHSCTHVPDASANQANSFTDAFDASVHPTDAHASPLDGCTSQ